MAAPRKENIRESIINATKELFCDKSISEISLAEISKKAGISKGTLYYYYKSKNDILFDITDQYLTEQWTSFIEWCEDETKDTSIHRLIKYVMERDIATAGIRMQLYCDAMQGDMEMREKLNSRYREFHDLISRKIAQRMKLIPSDYLAWLVLLASDGLIIQQVLNGLIDPKEFIRQTSVNLKLLDEYLKDMEEDN